MTNQTALLDKYRQPISDLRGLHRNCFGFADGSLTNGAGRTAEFWNASPPKHMSIWSQFWRMHDVAMLPNATSQPSC